MNYPSDHLAIPLDLLWLWYRASDIGHHLSPFDEIREVEEDERQEWTQREYSEESAEI